MKVDVNCIHCSCSCNKVPHAVDWGFNKLICYAACNVVHIYSYEDDLYPKHYQTLALHKKIITSVHWVKNDNEPENELIATSTDNTASIWTLSSSQFILSSLLEGHSGVVSNASSVYLPQDNTKKLVVVTLSIDSTAKIWIRQNTETVCTQTISYGSGFGLDAKFCALSDTNEIILLVSADDSHIHVYVQDNEDVFVPSIKLKGHQDWVQTIDTIKADSNSFYIASASQDNYIRIWKISDKEKNFPEVNSRELKIDSIVFQTSKGINYSVSLESVLSGHENWIYSVQWRKYKNDKGIETFQILSGSMDKTVIIWEYDVSTNIWLEKVRLGEVGGNTLGFYGAVFSSDGNIIIANGYQGAIHVWKFNKEESSWESSLSFGGHYSAVQDIDWDPDGEYLLSCSNDQTTRIHAPYSKNVTKRLWYEISRPQIHGYDMACLTTLNRYKFVSAGDEKVLRVFEAPRSFAEILNNLTQLNVESYIQTKMAEGASVPSLGLSNKAVFEEDLIKTNDSTEDQNSKKSFKDQYPDFYYTPMHLTAPPTEETLLQNTLWPEIQKLYGHPYEVFTVASNHAKTLVASACKASKVEHAGIILWCTSTWKQIAYLSFHSLTITQLEFSPNDEYLLSVSRDRMWALYKHFPGESPPYRKIANLDRKLGVHTRIIWSCSWSSDSLYFATASRDKKVAIWSRNLEKADENDEFSLCSVVLEVVDSATAISFAPYQVEKKYIIAIGLECGMIQLFSWSETSNWNNLIELNQHIAHHLNINRLRFSPVRGEAGSENKNSNVFQLASCSNDHHVKVYNICTHVE